MIRLFVCLLLALLVSACQTTTSISGLTQTSARQLDHWQIKGRIGYSNGEDGGHARVIWRQLAPQRGDLALSGPLGFGHVEIHYTPEGALLDSGDHQVRAANATLLAWRVTGLRLPIPALSWWVRALPWPAQDFHAPQLDKQGRLVGLTQAGWQLEFDRYQRHHSLSLPGRIRARKGDTRFTLLISSWSPLAETAP